MNFKIQMLAGNNLKSFPDASFKKTTTLDFSLPRSLLQNQYNKLTFCPFHVSKVTKHATFGNISVHYEKMISSVANLLYREAADSPWPPGLPIHHHILVPKDPCQPTELQLDL